MPPPTSSCFAWTRSLLSTVFTIISSGAYSLTSNLSLSSLAPPSSSYFNILLRHWLLTVHVITSLMRGDLSPWSQAEWPPMAPVTPGRRSVSPDTSLTSRTLSNEKSVNFQTNVSRVDHHEYAICLTVSKYSDVK